MVCFGSSDANNVAGCNDSNRMFFLTKAKGAFKSRKSLKWVWVDTVNIFCGLGQTLAVVIIALL
jgi:hypothetical protein